MHNNCFGGSVTDSLCESCLRVCVFVCVCVRVSFQFGSANNNANHMVLLRSIGTRKQGIVKRKGGWVNLERKRQALKLVEFYDLNAV